MPNESKHTPIPWELSTERHNSLAKVHVHSGTYRLEGDNESIGEIYPQTLVEEGRGEANGAFIVRAVNNHEALVAAAGALLEACRLAYRGDEPYATLLKPSYALKDVLEAIGKEG